MKEFELNARFEPCGDQPKAIKALVEGLDRGEHNQVLLGVTGSGKTFTMAHVIAKRQTPALILAPNKTLAAQLYGEMRSFFPTNAVEYFVSYYDYYQPEAYIPRTDTFIEKDAAINEEIERMRHSATRSLVERRDVIIIASVSCIYGLGAVESYREMSFSLRTGEKYPLADLARQLVKLQYKRNDMSFHRGTFRIRGDRLDLFPAHYEDRGWSLSFFGQELEEIYEIDALSGQRILKLEDIHVYPNSHYVTPGPTVQQAIGNIRKELDQRYEAFVQMGKLVEAQRLSERVQHDLESLSSLGFCPGIENYSRYLTGRAPGEPPPTLFEYLPKDALFIVDESHVSLPQLRAMSRGDAARKTTLSEYGFRLPSCRDNRPLTFEEWDAMRPQTLFVSATPGPWELEQTQGKVVEQIVRPTGLLDPVCSVHPTLHQIDHLLEHIRRVIAENGRVLVTTLTKRMAEDLSEYIGEIGVRTRYMHSDIDTLERIAILDSLRQGEIQVLVGINLLREGLDIPQCQLVAILDADKEGYLRSKTSLIQIIGRAARHPKGTVLLYADRMTPSLQAALDETSSRRERQQRYNEEHHIVPKAVFGACEMILPQELSPPSSVDDPHPNPLSTPEPDHKDVQQHIEMLRTQMLQAAHELDFERAAALRDHIHRLSNS